MEPAKEEPDYLKLILVSRVYDVAEETPLHRATQLSLRYGCNIFLKREDLQPVFSFKIRGAYNKMAHLTEEERKRGVICCSAGNHAQGVALAAQKMGLSAQIVMPLITPDIKVNAVKRFGGDVILHGVDFDEAKRECNRLTEASGRVLIHPYDDPLVIAGQGTIGVEILKQLNNGPLDAVFCAIGGGGLAAGITAYIKRIRPDVKIIGVEANDACAMYQSLRQGSRVQLDDVGLFADGAAVKLVGEETFKVLQHQMDEVVLVNNDEICAAIKDTFQDTRSVLEPAGALGLAGCKKYIETHGLSDSKKTFVCITSGANMNFDRLRFVAERAELGEKREAFLCVTIPEESGSFMKLYKCIHPRNVTEFSYRYSNPKEAMIFLGFSIKRAQETQEVIEQLKQQGMEAIDLSEDELSKTHLRYLVGGRSHVPHEKLYRFEFPEKPGNLKRFLEQLPTGFNVTLFHYRNQGGDVGRVLTAIQVNEEEQPRFQEFLRGLGFRYVDETNNAMFQKFLQS